jgi:hypothetical protein
MAGSQVTDFTNQVVGALGGVAPAAKLVALSNAASALQGAANAPLSVAQWQAAVAGWIAARNDLKTELRSYLLQGLPNIPGLDALAAATGWDSPEGLHGELDLGPLHLALASASLRVQPPPVGGQALDAILVGPYQPLGITASIASPFGGDALPGGGSIFRLPDKPGFAGLLHIPLGAVSADASAVLERMQDGTPSFLAVLGITFTTPIQLSFGFSLDRVGGIVGVHRTFDTDALARAVRTGAAGNALFAASPPPSPTALIADLRQLFPTLADHHVVGPTLRLSWLSIGVGSLLALDLGVIIELPTGKFAILGVARAQIPGAPGLLQLRIDVLGIFDPGQQLASIDASLVDSHVLGIFSVYGDAAMRLSWGSRAYAVMSIGGFYPGFNPEPARLPAMRRVGFAPDIPSVGLEIHGEGYFAITTNTIQLGVRIDASFNAGLTAHGFLQVDALVQFSPFHFVANCSAGFDVSAAGFHFCGVRLDGTISGPGPLVIHGQLTIETFLFDVSWDETFTIGSGPGDTAPTPPRLLDVLAGELADAHNLHAEALQDPAVVLAPRGLRAGIAAVPPTGTLKWMQRRAPLGLPIDRVNGQPLGSAQGVVVVTPGAAVPDRFSPGSYCTLTSAEALHRPPFDILTAGVALTPAAAPSAPDVGDDRSVDVIVILGGKQQNPLRSSRTDVAWLAELVMSSRRGPALSDATPLVTATREEWATVVPWGGSSKGYTSATTAHQFARQQGGVAVAAADADATVSLAGV